MNSTLPLPYGYRSSSPLSEIFKLTLAVFKMSVGYLTGSKGLFADGIHSLSDVVATTGVIVSLKISDKGDDERYPYGRGKVEFISCIFVYSVLFIVAILILTEA
ncbi:MAG TPA: cation transporter, partial [bacterium]|nr:cation transporter [bacterium]